MTNPTNKEIYQAMVELEDKIERSFGSVARAMEMIGEMVDVFAKRVDELQTEVDALRCEVDLLQKKAKKKKESDATQ